MCSEYYPELFLSTVPNMYDPQTIAQDHHGYIERLYHDEIDWYTEFLSSQKLALAFIVKARSFSLTSLKYLQEDPNIPSIEMDALQDFYKSTNGPYWVYSQQNIGIWNFTGLSVILFYSLTILMLSGVM